MEVRQIAALIIALLTIGCIAASFLYATRESRAERRGYKRSERSRARRNQERIMEAQQVRAENIAVERA
jgi:hypothetical protein